MTFFEQIDMVRSLGKRLRYWEWQFADQYDHKGEFDSRRLGATPCSIFGGPENLLLLISKK